MIRGRSCRRWGWSLAVASVIACGGDARGTEETDTVVTQPPSGDCIAFLEGSERASLQRLLESQLETFEAGF